MTIERLTQDILGIIAESALSWPDESSFNEWPERKAEVEAAITDLLMQRLRPLLERSGT
jgi:hypothetical protein